MNRIWMLAPSLALLGALSAGLSACQSPPAAPLRASTEVLPLDQAVARAADSLAAQLQPDRAWWQPRSSTPQAVLQDAALDGASGEETALTRRLDQQLAAALAARRASFELLPAAPESLARAQLLLVASIARLPAERQVQQLQLALVDAKSGVVRAQASARARDEGFDATPTPYYRDTPVLLMRDPAVQGYLSTAQAAPGTPAARAYWVCVKVSPLLQQAGVAYDNGRYDDALQLYRSAAQDAAGEQLRTYNGLYLAQWKLGHTAEAEQAFAKIVSLGLAARSLGIKFLFNPGSTEFWSDPRVSGPYGAWLRELARQSGEAGLCLDVVGHTSRTGSEAFNERLSAQRASYIQRRLEGESPALAGHLKASGMGFRENLVGSGSDDATDALDRRVEFKVSAC